jgi:methyl-accepting chemotaxis protein
MKRNKIKSSQRKNPRKKLNLSVKWEFQKWLIIRISGVVAVSSVVAAIILYIFSQQEVSSSFYSAHIQIRRVSDLLLPVMGAGAFVSLLSGLALALFLPQKIAGPIFRVQKSLNLIKDGDLTEEVILRKNDILKDLATSVNETTDVLRVNIQEIKKIHQELDRIIVSFENQKAIELSSRQKAALEQLRT